MDNRLTRVFEFSKGGNKQVEEYQNQQGNRIRNDSFIRIKIKIHLRPKNFSTLYELDQSSYTYISFNSRVRTRFILHILYGYIRLYDASPFYRLVFF